MDPKRKFFLLRQSKNFCSAPWSNVYLEPNGNIFTCCVAKTILGNVRTTKLEDILNNSISKKIRSDLLNDQAHPNCETCLKFSDDTNSWMRGHYNHISKNSNIDYDKNEFKLTSVDLRWSNTCNFKCVYCTPQLSSSIEKELNINCSNGDIGNQDVLNFVLANQEGIQEIYLAGGEPLLMKENRKFLEQYTNFNTELRINTNLSNINEKNDILDYIKKFKKIIWTVSVENTHERYEYTRYGGNWIQFLKNLEIVNQMGHTIRFNMVYFIGNAMTFYNDYIFLKNLIPNCQFTINPVVIHDAISSRNLPNQLKNRARQDLDILLKNVANNSSLCNNINNCIKELEFKSNGLDYKKYFDDIDNRRGTNWHQIFPELVI